MPGDNDLKTVLDVEEATFPFVGREGNDLDHSPGPEDTYDDRRPNLVALGAHLWLEVHQEDLSLLRHKRDHI